MRTKTDPLQARMASVRRKLRSSGYDATFAKIAGERTGQVTRRGMAVSHPEPIEDFLRRHEHTLP